MRFYVVAETDYLIGLLFKRDKLHNKAINASKKYFILLSPYVFMEFHLYILSGRIVVRDLKAFFSQCSKIIKGFNIRVLPDNLLIHSESFKLREEYRLTLFDSLHAATAIHYKIPLLSADKTYRGIKGLSWIDLKKI